MSKKALILVNLGTPDRPEKSSVRRYLFQFLNDRRVIDLPWLAQKMLVNLIIVPFRTSKSTALYKRVWTENGSPLLISITELQKKVQNLSGADTTVFAAMRYGKPGIASVLGKIKAENFQEITVFPLFPQYASSTTGSVYQEVMRILKSWKIIPAIKFIDQYYNHPAFVEAFAKQIQQSKPVDFEHILFSYHGLPYRHTDKIHPKLKTSECSCDKSFPAHGTFCYRATCYETTRLLVSKLNLEKSNYSVAFQSRLSENWLNPFSDEVVVNLAKSGVKRLLVAAPAFTADSLETLVEIREDYRKLFIENGGEELILADNLNSETHWAQAILEICKG